MSFPPSAATRPRLTIDIDAIAWNWRRLVSEAAPAETAAVVKADAYGLGLRNLGPFLWLAGVRTFFVARLDEALVLRGVLPTARIMVLDGLALGGAEDFIRHRVDPVLNQPAEVEAWHAAATRHNRRLPAVLHTDTGMLRLGCSGPQLDALEAAEFPGLGLELVMSHLACADEPDHELNALQAERFAAIRARFPSARGSLANSSGIFLGAAWKHDLCRPGIALWGANPTPGRANPMRPVVTLEAPILQIHEVDVAKPVGYGAVQRVAAGSRTATIPLGYADGILRAAEGGAMARVADVEVPVIGRISMDLVTLDITAVPQDRIGPGSLVQLIWGADGVDRLAAAGGTIAYEVLTRLGSRFDRHYLSAAFAAPGAV